MCICMHVYIYMELYGHIGICGDIYGYVRFRVKGRVSGNKSDSLDIGF